MSAEGVDVGVSDPELVLVRVPERDGVGVGVSVCVTEYVGVTEGDVPSESDAVGDGVGERVGCRHATSVTAPAAPVEVEPPTNVAAPAVAMAALT